MTIPYDPHEEVSVEDLKAGDLIDLENDEYGDPFGHRGHVQDDPDNRDVYWHDYEADHMALECEYAEVEGAERESASNTVVYTNIVNISFPHGWKVKRYVAEDEEGGTANLIVDGQKWKDGDGSEVFPLRVVYDLATRVRDQGYTDVKVEYLND